MQMRQITTTQLLQQLLRIGSAFGITPQVDELDGCVDFLQSANEHLAAHAVAALTRHSKLVVETRRSGHSIYGDRRR